MSPRRCRRSPRGQEAWRQAMTAFTPIKALLAFAVFIVAACGNDSNNPTSNTNARNPAGAGPAPVSLGSAGDPGASGSYAILAKSGISSVPGSAVTGDMGLSPAAASFV